MSKSKSPFETISKILYRKNINPKDFDQFKNSLMALYNYAKDHASESEEHHKNILSNFLKNNFYQDYEINTHKRIDLAIAKQNSNIEVLIESKSPSNTMEMISKSDINKKAMQEAVLYFMRERFKSDGSANNIHIKHIIITNNIDFFIFDAHLFDKYFAQNSQFKKEFLAFENGQTSDDRTKAFYNDIAKKQIDAVKEHLEFCYFSSNIALGTDAELSENELIAIYKLLSADHLLKLPFANDANSLNKEFYNELLYILGLTESKEDGKVIITRFPEGKRQDFSLIENTINEIDSDKLDLLTNIKEFGETKEEQIFSIALELVISWLNRILFLKLLESNLLKYNNFAKEYKFLNYDKIQEFIDLKNLFFEILAKKESERRNRNKNFDLIPYLNSSLFEETDLEKNILQISNLKSLGTISIYSSTVLKQVDEKKQSGEIKTLEYLLKFLDAYDFGSTSKNIISEKSKTIINASVLGLIFEKINGYKDGSFYTPGYITMYMCRESIRAAVLQKFNEFYSENCASSLNNESKNTAKNSNKKGKNLKDNKSSEETFDKQTLDEQEYKFKSFEGLKNYILNHHEPSDLKKFNEIINSLKICDPAVGSGHFLVSALNEIISIKSELKILTDSDGNRLQISIDIENDELIINDLVHKGIYIYNPLNSENAKVQKTLFHEKQNIIENCLFGVDINPKSVMICRLRLWIELLKNAYYKNTGTIKELETLPNIDINIKCGNSLISKLNLEDAISQANKKNLEFYKIAVATYKNTYDKIEKNELKKSIDYFKNLFKDEYPFKSKSEKKLDELKDKLKFQLNQTNFGDTEKLLAKKVQDIRKLEEQITHYVNLVKKELENPIYTNTIEWRIDFPEVLDNDGNFLGFDLVIGNPPYIQLQSISRKPEVAAYDIYKTFEKTGDIYALFIEKSCEILSKNGLSSLIVSNKWMRAGYGKSLRDFLATNTNPKLLIDFGGFKVFDHATVDVNILLFDKKVSQNNNLKACVINKDFDSQISIRDYVELNQQKITNLSNEAWTISSNLESQIKEKIEKIGTPLKDWDVKINYGIKTGLNEAFIIEGKLKDEIINKESQSIELIKPLLRGRDIKRYKAEFADLWLINIPKGFTIKSMKSDKLLKSKNDSNVVEEPIPRYGYEEYDDAWAFFSSKHTLIAKNLEKYKTAAEKRQDKGDYWWELRACAYLDEFEKEKIIYPETTFENNFFLDKNNYFIDKTAFILISKNSKFLISVLNSSFFKFVYKKLFSSIELGQKGFQLNKFSFEKFPIPQNPEKEQEPFINLVDIILAKKEKGEDTSDEEKEIDQMVYKLYELTDEEIEIVEKG